MSENLGKIYEVDNLYDAIQMVKELPASEVFEIWKKLNNEEERKKLLIADLEKDNLMIYIENLKYYNPDVLDLFKKEKASGYEALNRLCESVALKNIKCVNISLLNIKHTLKQGVNEMGREKEKIFLGDSINFEYKKPLYERCRWLPMVFSIIALIVALTR